MKTVEQLSQEVLKNQKILLALKSELTKDQLDKIISKYQ